MSVIGEEELRSRLDSGAEDEEANAAELWNRALALFELAPEAHDPDAEAGDVIAQTAAAYLTESKEIVVVDRGAALDEEAAVAVLAHEMVHALQDAEHDIDAYTRRWATSYDAALALTSLIEGEAVLYEGLVVAQLRGLAYDEVDWDRLYREWRREEDGAARRDEAPVTIARVRLPYAFGGSFVDRYFAERGPAGIAALFEDPPQTTWEILFGPPDEDLGAARETLAEHGVPVLPEPFAELSATSLGAWIEHIFAARRGYTGELLWDAPESTAADLFAVQHDAETDTLVASWRMRMLGDAQPSLWPNTDIGVLEGGTDHERRELAILAADPALPESVEALAWRARAPDAEAAAAGSAARNAQPWSSWRAAGCARARWQEQ